MTITFTRPALTLPRFWRDAPAFTALALFITAALIPLSAAMALDTRLFQDASPWIKPIKFHIALAIYLITLAFFARYVPATTRISRRWRVFTATVCTSITLELLWVGTAATLNTASHYNQTSPAWAIAYALAGIFAVLLTSGSLGYGVAIARNRTTGLPPALHLSITLGLILTFILTLIAAGTLASGTGHFIGPSTRQLPLLGWSRDAGDLRVAHFFATHALHAIPLAGLIASKTLPPRTARLTVIAAALAYTAFVTATYAQALMGLPFIH